MGEDSTIRLWDAVTGTHKHTLKGHTSNRSISLAFSPDGGTLASGSGDNTIRLWDGVTGEYRRVLTGYTHPVTSVTFSPDGGTLASASGGEIHLRDAITGIHKQILHAEYGFGQ